jgi:hypothetical protein
MLLLARVFIEIDVESSSDNVLLTVQAMRREFSELLYGAS